MQACRCVHLIDNQIITVSSGGLQTIRDAFVLAKKKIWIRAHDEVVIVSGVTHGVSGGTNTLKVVTVPE